MVLSSSRWDEQHLARSPYLAARISMKLFCFVFISFGPRHRQPAILDLYLFVCSCWDFFISFSLVFVCVFLRSLLLTRSSAFWFLFCFLIFFHFIYEISQMNMNWYGVRPQFISISVFLLRSFELRYVRVHSHLVVTCHQLRWYRRELSSRCIRVEEFWPRSRCSIDRGCTWNGYFPVRWMLTGEN